MKMLISIASIAASAFCANLSAAAEPTDPPAFNVDAGERPIGVDVKDWIPVSDKLGFVVVKVEAPKRDKNQYAAPRDAVPLIARHASPPAPAGGYFMIKTADGWRRVIVMSPEQLATANP
jgi:hypothetical protein